MPESKLDADLIAYDERHLKLEHFLSEVERMCDRCESRGMNFVMTDELRKAMKGLE